ncbi:hypothetical protein [Microbacterium sp. SA39]|uniref:hypothetical protein n=1 Tax=Microbacterium sp. SA39 TaxID=1263625 RepID=UPI00126A7464|nr:hypothetical protein [Microbacterium sp. SA39]
MFLIAGAVAGVAAVTAGVVVVGQLTAPAPTPQVEAIPVPTADPREPGQTIPKPSPTSGTTITEPFPGTTPQAGQMLRITGTAERIVYRTGYADVYSYPASVSNPPISAALMRSYSTTDVPGDRAGEWVSRYGPQSERLQIFGQDNEVVRMTWDTMVPYSPGVTELRSTGGLEYGDLPSIGGPTYYDQQPRDPQALLDYWYDFFSEAGDSREDSVMMEILSVLHSNYAPADMRVAYIEALKVSGRAAIDSTSGSIVTYAVDFDQIDARRETISIDMNTGWVTEYTQKYVKDDGGLVPAGVPDIRVRIETTIMDAP